MNQTERDKIYEKYERQAHIIGRAAMVIGITLFIGTPFVFGTLLDAGVNWPGFWRGLLQVAPLYIPVCMVEFLIYAPMLGSGASYLAFITGNLSNLKIPCVVNARDICETEVGTPENDIVSTLSVAVSSLVTVLVLAVGVLCLAPLTPVLENPVLQPAFNNVIPALFGALGCKYLFKSVKLSAVPLAAVTLLCILAPGMISNVSMLIIPAGLLALCIGYVMYKKDWL